VKHTLDAIGTTGGKATTEQVQPAHVPGFWVNLNEAEARAIAKGHLPDHVRVEVEAMVDDYDAHLRAAERQLAKRP
jgi:hypothetical protein